VLDTPKGVIAARFHRGFGRVVAQLGERLAREHAVTQVALTGGVFQNAILLDQVQTRLSRSGLTVLTHRDVPPNDGGIALGQAAIASARMMPRSTPGVTNTPNPKRQTPCV
jgi:hydrogenase maturation protein HypF